MLNWFKKRRDKIILLNIRKQFTAFGYDLSSLSDEELRKGFIETVYQLSKIGLSIEEANKYFKLFGCMEI